MDPDNSSLGVALTARQRSQIKNARDAGKSVRETAREMGISPTTVQKWRNRKSVKSKTQPRRRSPALVDDLLERVIRSRKGGSSLANIVAILAKRRIETSISSVRRALARSAAEGEISEREFQGRPRGGKGIRRKRTHSASSSRRGRRSRKPRTN